MSTDRSPGNSSGGLTEQRLIAILQAIRTAEDADELADNASLSAALGLSLDDVAACLEGAKEQALIWGHRGGTKPGPWFSELEVTVQGKRYLASAVG